MLCISYLSKRAITHRRPHHQPTLQPTLFPLHQARASQIRRAPRDRNGTSAVKRSEWSSFSGAFQPGAPSPAACQSAVENDIVGVSTTFRLQALLYIRGPCKWSQPSRCCVWILPGYIWVASTCLPLNELSGFKLLMNGEAIPGMIRSCNR